MNRTHFFKRPSNAMVRMFNFRAYFSLLTCIKATGERGGGGGGRGGERVLNKCLYVYTGRLRPEIQLDPYTFINHFFM